VAAGITVEQALADAVAAVNALRVGSLSARSIVERALAVAARWEPLMHAFAWMDPDRVLAVADRVDAIRPDERGVLHGLPVAVKDVFDTAGIPTEFGSRLFQGHVPETSAAAVVALEAAGAILLGKTVTAELAYYSPGPTLNPWDLARTPGGSSMGSAAAVAVGAVPGAIGTQTNGSVIRPAAFCGVTGFKPSAGLIPTAGVLEFSRTLDQVGVFSADAAGSGLIAWTLAGRHGRRWGIAASASAPRLAVVRTSDWERSETAMRDHFQADVHMLREAGAVVDELHLPPELDHSIAVHRQIMAVEAYRALGEAVASAPRLVSPTLIALLEEGRASRTSDYQAALEARGRLIQIFAGLAGEYEALLTLPAAGEAPPAATTGDPTFCTRWTLVGAPAISIPTGLGPYGLPLGLQLVGRPGSDAGLVSLARWAEEHLSRGPLHPLLSKGQGVRRAPDQRLNIGGAP
jgi:Asp-tRNA(Asn)/Glu-tRNA(Gln) amidotransferase A subunit family amidase